MADSTNNGNRTITTMPTIKENMSNGQKGDFFKPMVTVGTPTSAPVKKPS